MKFLSLFLSLLVVFVLATDEKLEPTTAGGAGLLGACEDAKNAFSGVSNCPLRVSLCKLAEFEQEMRKDCSKTCGFC